MAAVLVNRFFRRGELESESGVLRGELLRRYKVPLTNTVNSRYVGVRYPGISIQRSGGKRRPSLNATAAGTKPGTERPTGNEIILHPENGAHSGSAEKKSSSLSAQFQARVSS